MNEFWMQPPLFELSDVDSDARVQETRETIVSHQLAVAASEHALAIDLIGLNMRLHVLYRGNVSVDELVRWEREWDDIVSQLMVNNSPVVAFLVSLVSDLAVQLCALRDVSHEDALAQMRAAIGKRLDVAEQMMMNGEHS